MRYRLVAGCALALTLTIGTEEAISEESTLAVDHRGTFARPIERSAPRYPQSALRSGAQGWVRLSFVVTEDGSVVDPVVEDSTGNRYFERAAMQSVESWSYEPATFDGEPVQQCENEVMISFFMEGSEAGVRRPFYRRYTRADEALNEGDVPRAEELIEQMSQHSMTGYELARQNLLRARVAEAHGDPAAQLRHLRRVVAGGGKWIDDETYPLILYVMLALELESLQHSAALRTWDQLSELNTSSVDLTQAEAAIETIRQFVAGPEALTIDARLDADDDCDDCRSDWLYYPLRKQFGFADIDGSIDNLEIRCQWQRVVDDVSNDKIWHIPETWGECRILVTGEPGTSFTLVEIPGSQQAGSLIESASAPGEY